MTEVVPSTAGRIPEPRHDTEQVGACETLPRTPSGTIDARNLTATIAEHGFQETASGFFGGQCKRCLGELMLSAGSPVVLPPECALLRMQAPQTDPGTA